MQTIFTFKFKPKLTVASKLWTDNDGLPNMCFITSFFSFLIFHYFSNGLQMFYINSECFGGSISKN